ncbi:MAG: FAD-binding protein [Alphaproteobacteria bacterium]|nr:FAD-binding protein [Alphaproteobacteria bacterium]
MSGPPTHWTPEQLALNLARTPEGKVAQHYDVIVVGAGTAGIPAAGFAASRGARVLLLDAADRIGGTLFLSGGNMSAGGTRVQAAKGIKDSPDQHYDDIMRISRGSADPTMVRLAVDHAPNTIHWLLDIGFEMLPEMPIINYGHEAYSVARTYWGPKLGLSVLESIGPWLQGFIDSGQVTLQLNTKLAGLRQDAYLNIVGAVIKGPDHVHRVVSADNYVLTTGGYTGNRALFPMLNGGHPLYPLGSENSMGDGVLIATGVGGYVRGGEMLMPTFGGVEDPVRPGFYNGGLCNLTPQYRQPWEIYVNREGERFVCEDTDSVDARERALLAQTDLRFWVVFDEAIKEQSLSIIDDWPDNPYRGGTPPTNGAIYDNAFGGHPDFFRADSIAALAALTGIDAVALERTVAAFNEGVRNGTDPLGRKHHPLPIQEAPFYAIRNHGTAVKSYAGIAVDDQLRVLDRNDKPIGNLYAAGELIGGGVLTGNSFCGGMSVTPALTFGRLLGESLLQWRRIEAAAAE